MTRVIRGTITDILKRGGAGLGLLKLISMALGMLASIFVARNLGAQGYGQVVFVISVLHLLALPSSSAMTPLIVRQLSSLSAKGEVAKLRCFLRWSFLITLRVSAGLTLIVVSWVGVRALTGFMGEQDFLLLVGAGAIMLWAMAARVTGILQGFGRVVLSQAFDWIFNPLVYLGMLWVLWSMGRMLPASVLLATLAGLGASVVIGWIVVKQMFPVVRDIESRHCRDGIHRDWLLSWRHFVFLQFIGMANMQIPILMLGGLGETVDAGLFRAAENTASVLSLSLLIVNSVIAPRIAAMYASGDSARLEQLMKGAARLAFGITLPLAIIIALWGRNLLMMLFGDDFASAYVAMLILLLGHLINVSTGSVALLLNMTGYESKSARGLTIALGVNLLVCALLVPSLGVNGACVGAALSMSIWNLMLFLQVKRHLGISAGIV